MRFRWWIKKEGGEAAAAGWPGGLFSRGFCGCVLRERDWGIWGGCAFDGRCACFEWNCGEAVRCYVAAVEMIGVDPHCTVAVWPRLDLAAAAGVSLAVAAGETTLCIWRRSNRWLRVAVDAGGRV